MELAVRFTRISLFGIYFNAVIYIFTGFLQMKGSYYIPALIGFPLNLVTVISIYISTMTNTSILAIGSVIAAVSSLILLIPYIYKYGYKYRVIFNLKDKNIIEMAYIALPVIIGISVDQINMLVDKTIASSIAVGGISALNYASKLNLFVQGIFVMSMSVIMYPAISRMAAENDIAGLKVSVTETVNSINLLVIPATFGFIIFAEPIIKLLFGRGAFDTNAITMTSSALLYYSIGMIGYGLREVLSKAFYALHDSKTPMINAGIAMVLNIVLNLILSRYMGIGGLALATSISALFCTGLLFVSLRKKIGHFGMKNVTISFIKIMMASAIMGVAAKLAYAALIMYTSKNLSLIVSVVTGVLIYFVTVYFLRVEEATTIISSIKGKIKRDIAMK